MDASEFGEWLTHHKAAYPGLARWLAQHDGQMVVWAKILAKTDLAAAKRATDDLVASDAQPRGYGEHPRHIKRLAYDQAPQRDTRYIDGQQVVSCVRCQDSGLLSVISPGSLSAIWQDDRAHGLRWCVVACDCDAGTIHATRRQGIKRPIPRFTTAHMLISFDEVCSAQIDETGRANGVVQWDAARQVLLVRHESDEQKYRPMTTDQWAMQCEGEE